MKKKIKKPRVLSFKSKEDPHRYTCRASIVFDANHDDDYDYDEYIPSRLRKRFLLIASFRSGHLRLAETKRLYKWLGRAILWMEKK